MKEKIEIGDTVEVYCPEISQDKRTHIVRDIQGEWIVFDKEIGKIQEEYCTKIKQ